MTTFKALKQYIEDLETGLAMRFDDLTARLDAIENNLAAIKARLPGRLPIDPHFVAECLGLTPKEGRIAAALAEGRTVRDIAETRGREVSTIRWHLREINRKLKISRQADLVRLVLLLPHGTDPDAETPRPEAVSGSGKSPRSGILRCPLK